MKIVIAGFENCGTSSLHSYLKKIYNKDECIHQPNAIMVKGDMQLYFKEGWRIIVITRKKPKFTHNPFETEALFMNHHYNFKPHLDKYAHMIYKVYTLEEMTKLKDFPWEHKY